MGTIARTAERVTVVIKEKGQPPRVFGRGDEFAAYTPNDVLGILGQRIGWLPWCDPCTVNGGKVPLDSDYQLIAGDKLVVRAD